MEYTISELARLSGVSTRTLRYYDEINLLKPARINKSGYRIYSEKEVNRLQQILFYRELNVPLDTIAFILNNPDFDYIHALEHHLENLKLKQFHLDKLIQTVEKTIAHMKGEIKMSDYEKFEAFKEKLIEENEKNYGKEIRQKYGEEVVNQFNKQFQNLTKERFDEMRQVEQELLALLKTLETNDYTSPLAKKLVDLHKKWLMFSWSTYSKEAHRNLADMYVADHRFTAYYDDKVASGATKFLRNAIHYHS